MLLLLSFTCRKMDGVVIGRGTMPGGNSIPYNLGDTATHEVCSTGFGMLLVGSWQSNHCRFSLLRSATGLDCTTRFKVIRRICPCTEVAMTSAPDGLSSSCLLGGCFGSGDLVSDTPAEASPAYECDLTRNTCSSAGNDPVQNYMDYTEDNCLSRFTTKQRERMIAQWNLYRSSGNVPPSPTVPRPQPPVPRPFHPRHPDPSRSLLHTTGFQMK
jgi:Pregnancy-associated plasma protein-A